MIVVSDLNEQNFELQNSQRESRNRNQTNLQCLECGRLPVVVTAIGLQTVADLLHQTKERSFGEQQFGRLLVESDLLQRQHAWSVSSLALLLADGLRDRFAFALAGDQLAGDRRGIAATLFGLIRTNHFGCSAGLVIKRVVIERMVERLIEMVAVERLLRVTLEKVMIERVAGREGDDREGCSSKR